MLPFFKRKRFGYVFGLQLLFAENSAFIFFFVFLLDNHLKTEKVDWKVHDASCQMFNFRFYFLHQLVAGYKNKMFVLLLAEWQLSAKANDNFIYWERRALIPHKQFSIILVTNENSLISHTKI